MEELTHPRPGGARLPWLPVALYAGLILAVSSIPAHRMPDNETLWDFDKLIHACEYAVLAALLGRAFALGPPRLSPVAALAVAFGAAAVFGVLDEIYQTFTGRAGTVTDAIADAGGALAGALIAFAWRRRRRDDGDHSRV